MTDGHPGFREGLRDRSDSRKAALTDRMKHLADTVEERTAGYIQRWIDRDPTLRDFLRAKPR